MASASLSGKVAVVTGAAQGIGKAVAKVLAADGIQVALIDYNASQLHDTVKELQREGYTAAAFPADVRESSSVDHAMQQIIREMDHIDVAVNVAGVLDIGPVAFMDDEDWHQTFAVNTHGVFYVSRAAARHMIPRKTGVIITVGSNAYAMPRVNMSAYAASKAAAAHFTKCLGLELAQHGIRCNIVSPGSTDTDMQRGMWTDELGAEAVISGSLENYRVGIPLGRIAEAEDIADTVAFLISDKAKHITMCELRVDGGATLGV
ncbi:2,3-dihydro-2,3-dihydroxybenzoate dehydrogenase [Paenibacillus sp. FSL H7-0326]|uniref:2,3-dihydro-2,3-dihydroxybenzoate dehydrogenase n=1 Tax=Paenibacillus sp. FSL H7-0326 TaxID=1921144 RepID=UPI00096C451A|nr:2,3-dihydro-2,3-dihydroxybenzoate dehydrogenase [Paenibacillus sp. FSL H7-0326]OMC70790.1 2,3-dihydro-2,3-dihydroxybenzoate dehydrogenase [Paenibacillus sp. FSL H7-0326]